MRCTDQVSPYVLHERLALCLRIVNTCGLHGTFSRRSVNKLKEASALKKRILPGCWLSVLLVVGGFAPGQQSTEAVPGLGLPSAARLQQGFDTQLLARRSLAQPARTTLPPVHGTGPGSPKTDACAKRAADPADRQWQAEWTSGKKLADDLERHITLISDPNITEYLNRLEQAIVLNSHLRGCFVVKLVNDVEANAYSFPGGFLYVTSGMILTADNEAELIAALAHETGHVTARHFTKLEAKRRWRLGQLVTLKLLRNAEFEADRLALKYEAASGYDPIELARLLENAFQEEGEPSSFFARLFDAHPSTDKRIKRARQATNRLVPQTDYVVDTSEFHEVKGQVADVTGVTNPELPPHEERLTAPAQ
jgi:hypothetical protein